MKVCLIMVTYNRFNILEKTIEEVLNQSRLPDYFIVVDNCSTDGTYQRLQSGSRFVAIQTKANEGYGAAASIGIEFACASYTDIEYFWIMDDDSRPSNVALQTLLDGYNSIISEKVGLIGLVGFKLKFGGYNAINSVLDSSSQRFLSRNPDMVESDFVLMDGSLITMEAVKKCGIYVKDYFMIAEDYEYCKRILQHDFKIALLLSEDARMDRLALGAGAKFSRASIWRGYYQARNHVHILRNYFSIKDLLGYSFRQVKFLLAALLAPDRFERIYFRMLGIFHGLLGKKGRTIDPSRF